MQIAAEPGPGSALDTRKHNALNKIFLGKEKYKYHRQHRHQ